MVPNQRALFARVVIDSNLPQLDREFEYRVPLELLDVVEVGQEVSVQFGRGKSSTTGYVVALSSAPEHPGELASIEAINNPVPILFESSYLLMKALAARQACTVAELIRLALPNRAPTVDKRITSRGKPGTSSYAKGLRSSTLVEPFGESSNNRFAWLLQKIAPRLESGESVLLLVPDERAIAEFSHALSAHGVAFSEYSANLTKVVKYSTFLEVAREAGRLVIGTRSAAFLPIKNLGLVLFWDEGDPSYVEQAAPYLSTREVVLVRQQLEQFDLAFFGHSISSDLQRLCEIGYLSVDDALTRKPAIAASDESLRVDSLAWKAIQQSIQSSRPVLVQVSSRGTANSAFCKNCRERVLCTQCHGPLWFDTAGKISCRWCNALQLNTSCGHCGQRDLATGRAGASRTVAEFGRAFPGARVIESSSDHRLESAPTGKTIVVSTPGSEPLVDGGYGAVILLDAGNLLARDTLRAKEEALRNWANAISHLAPNGRVTITGISGGLAQDLCLWNLRKLMSEELASRRELSFPPAIRMASVLASEQALLTLVERVRDLDLIQVLGPIPMHERKQKIQDEWRLLLKYPYAATSQVAELLKAFALEQSISSKAFNTRSGRPMRPVRVRMDEVEVI